MSKSKTKTRRATSVPAVGGVTADIDRSRIRAGFMRDGKSPTFAGWMPQLRDAREDVQAAWPLATARAIDSMQNVGWIAGGIEQAVANTVGTGLRLDAKPARRLFASNTSYSEWTKKVEEEFAIYARNPYECDVEARRNFGQQQAVALRSYFAAGEAVAEFPWRRRPGATYATKTRVVPPQRLSQRSADLDRIIQGVQMDADGMPVAYLFRVDDKLAGLGAYGQEIVKRARDGMGRPNVLHVFDGMAGQVRGITPLVPALRVARQFDQLANATLMKAIISQAFAASITSDEVTEEAIRGLITPQEEARFKSQGVSPYDVWFEAQSGWYDRAAIDLGVAGRLVHLFPGQKLDLHASEGAPPNFKDFALFLLREIARALGITYESMTGDYAGVTFSSVRFATDEIWRIVMMRRQNIVAPFCQAVYEAWLEEAIDNGTIEFPGGIENFIMNRAAACNAEWKGSPKPQADEGVAARANETHLKMGTKSEFQIAEENGEDYEDVVVERARAKQLRKENGIDDPILGQPQPDKTDESGGQRDTPPKKPEPAAAN